MLTSTPAIVPTTTEPFFSSIVTVSFTSFIRKLQGEGKKREKRGKFRKNVYVIVEYI